MKTVLKPYIKIYLKYHLPWARGTDNLAVFETLRILYSEYPNKKTVQ
jgi:hypothetical protein